ncbi:MAG: pyrroloquinoline quinone biosynthesis protein PqqE [Alphaproteobacteria bacterium]|nr:pyrroloquinoline quinone biosynthesis protein PqqE [Alphaproteobacteria bacterium]
MNARTMTREPPLAILAELTHRCPLRCVYCSNPLALDPASGEMETESWLSVIDQAADMGVLQIHFSGGEPTARKDLDTLVARADGAGLYVNLITSGVLLTDERIATLAEAGLAHVQLGFQDSEAGPGEWISGYAGGHAKKLEAARMIRDAGLALTVNVVVHRHNAVRVPQIIQMAVDLGAHRVEIANVQYYGWGLRNRAVLMPDRAQTERMTEVVEEARERLKGVIVIDYVTPDYYARYPKSCMGGWARRFMNLTPAGKVLPCHAAESIPGLKFDSVRNRPLADIWENGQAFRKYRATDWLPESCRSCERREIDWGGCRCQAMALTGDAANMDPVCMHSSFNDKVQALAEHDAVPAGQEPVYRTLQGASKETV